MDNGIFDLTSGSSFFAFFAFFCVFCFLQLFIFAKILLTLIYSGITKLIQAIAEFLLRLRLIRLLDVLTDG